MIGRTYFCLHNDAREQGKLSIIAYFTLSNRAIDISELGKNKKKAVLGDYPGRDGLKYAPTFLIGQLGRSDNYSHEDLPGDILINECYYMLSAVSKIIGGKTLVLDCRGHMYDNFYYEQGFKKLYDQPDENGLWTVYKKLNFDEYAN